MRPSVTPASAFRRALLWASLLLAVLTAPAAFGVPEAGSPGPIAPYSGAPAVAGRYLGRLRPDASVATARQTLTTAAATTTTRSLGQNSSWVVIDFAAASASPGGTAAKTAPSPLVTTTDAVRIKADLAALAATGLFDYVEPDYLLSADAVPTDSAFTNGTLWGLRNLGQSAGTAGADIDAVRAWDLTTGSSSVIVAVIDSGIRYTHQDLASRMWRNPGEIAGNGLDDDANGYVDDVFGINAAANTGDPMDDNDHGTHCAGTIGAAANDGAPHVGVCWDVRLMALKFLTASGTGSTADAIECIDYARLKGAHIMSNSWGGGGASQALADAITRARDAGILFVAAAGNDGLNNDATPHYPSNYPLANVVSVAALDRNDALASFSNYGAASVHLGAPGVAIYSSTSGSNSAYASFNGTSMATPHVAGVAALIKSRFPTITLPELRQRLLSSTRPLTALNGRTITGGALQAYQALTVAADGNLEVTVSAIPSPLVASSSATLSIRVSDLAIVTDASVSGTLDGIGFTALDDGATPDTAVDGTYTARLTVPAGGAQATVALAVTAPGKNRYTGTHVLARSTAPANDAFTAAIAATTTRLTGDNRLATAETGEPRHASFTPRASLWWTWTAPRTATATFTTYGSSFDTILALYSGTTLSALTPVASNDDAGGTLQSSVTFTAISGVTYRIAVDGYSGARGDIVLNLPQPALTNQPPVFTRQPLDTRVSAGDSLTLTAEVASNSAVTYRWQKDGTDLVDDSRISGSTTPGLSITATVLSDSGGYALLATNPDGTTSSRSAIVTIDPPAIRPPNDVFAAATLLTGSAAQATGDNTNGSAEAGEPAHAGQAAARSVWWTWTAPTTTAVNVATLGSTFDTRLAVYTGTGLATLTTVAASDDIDGTTQSAVSFVATQGTAYHIAVDGRLGATGLIQLALTPGAGTPPTIIFTSPARTVLAGDTVTLEVRATGTVPLTYRWQRDGLDLSGQTSGQLQLSGVQTADSGLYTATINNPFGTAESATISLTVRPPDSAPLNDPFAAAVVIPPGVTQLTGTNRQATRETGEPAHAGTGGGQSVWWIWTPATSGSATLTTDGSDFDTVLAVYTGSDVAALLPIAADDDGGAGSQSSVTFAATTGVRYYVAVDGFYTSTGDITLHVPAAGDTGLDSPPVILSSPASLTASSGINVIFTSTAAGSPTPSLQWETSSDSGSTWTSLLDDGVRITGATTSQLNYRQVSAADHRRLFRLRATNLAGSSVSAAASLSVDSAPLNDAFAEATFLEPDQTRILTNNTRASAETGEPSHAGQAPTRSLWWLWRPAATGSATITTAGSSFDTVLAVYTGQTLGSTLRSVAANDDSGGSGQSSVTFTAQADTLYSIAVDGFNGASGDIVLNVPAGARIDGTSPQYLSTTITSGSTTTYRAQFSGRPVPAVRWRLSTDQGATWIDLTDDGRFSGTSTATLGISPFNREVDGYQVQAVATNSAGTATSAVHTFTIPPATAFNDAFAAPDVFPVGAVYRSSTFTGATAETGEPAHDGSTARASLWWTWTAPASGVYRFSSETYDISLSLYTGDALTGLTRLARYLPTLGIADLAFRRPALAFRVTAGTTYHVALDRVANGAAVAYAGLQISPGLNHDNFADAAPLTGSSGQVSGDAFRATREEGEPSHHNAYGHRSLWYRWTAPATGDWVWHTQGSQFATLLAIYRGSALGQLTRVASNYNSGRTGRSRLTLSATAGETYFIAVSDYFSALVASQSFTLQWSPPDRVASSIALFYTASGQTQALVDGDLIPSTGRGTLFPRHLVGSPARTHVYTVRSVGEADLLFPSPHTIEALEGEATAFRIGVQLARLNSGLTSLFSVIFQPTTSGLHRALVHLPTNDPQHPSFTFLIEGRSVGAPQLAAPAVTRHTLFAGTPLDLTVPISGDGPFSYQWRRDGQNLPGATASSFHLDAATLADAGRYELVATNAYGSTTGDPIDVLVLPPSRIAVRGQGQLIPSGESAARDDNGTDFGLVLADSPREQTFTLENTSDTPLTLTGSPRLRFDGLVAPSPFALVGSELPATLAAGASVSFTLRYTPRATSTTEGGFFVIESDDPTTPSYLVPLRARTVTPPRLPALADEVNLRGRSPLSLTIAATGDGPFTYQWRKNGQPLIGATTTTYSRPQTVPDDAGLYDVMVQGPYGTTVSEPIDVYVGPPARLFNLSARVRSGPGEGVLIAGFVIEGTKPKELLITGLGPALTRAGVAGALASTRLLLHAGGALTAENAGWELSPDATAIQAVLARLGGAPMRDGSADSALLVRLPPGGYTVHLDSGPAATAGVGLIEVYESDGDASRSRLLNLSARAVVGTDDNILIPGLIVSGVSPRTLLIHAVGAGLERAGVRDFLRDPAIELTTPSGIRIASNDNAASDAALRQAAQSIGATPLLAGSRDAGLLVTVSPGSYTVLVSGVGRTTGVCVVEVFDVTPPSP